MTTLCIADRDRRIALAELHDDALRWIGGTPSFRDEIMAKWDEISASGIRVTFEQKVGETLRLLSAEVSTKDPQYLQAVADEFVRNGFRARVYDRDRAELWRYAHLLPFIEEDRALLLDMLDVLPDEKLGPIRDACAEALEEAVAVRAEVAKADAALLSHIETFGTFLGDAREKIAAATS
jgi:hypothetical protein